MSEIDSEHDVDNPSWAGSGKLNMRLSDLPVGLQRTLREIQAESEARRSGAILHLTPDLSEALKATGPGWEQRAEEALREKFLKDAA